MKPASYRIWAARIASVTERPSLRLPSCCSVEVIKGTGADDVLVRLSTVATWKVAPGSAREAKSSLARSSPRWQTAPSPEAWTSSPVSPSKSRPTATRTPPTATSVALKAGPAPAPPPPPPPASAPADSSALPSQYSLGTNLIRSRSRSTTRRRPTDWTLPADRPGATFLQRRGDTV